MAARTEQAAIVMLAVHLDQHRAELAQQAERDRLIVDEGAAAAIGADDAADDKRLARLALQAILREQGARRMILRKLEADIDHRLRLPVAHQPAVGAGAEREAERVEQDRLARPRLAGEHAEARAEFEIQALDQHDVANGEPGQHRPDCATAEKLRSSVRLRRRVRRSRGRRRLAGGQRRCRGGRRRSCISRGRGRLDRCRGRSRNPHGRRPRP